MFKFTCENRSMTMQIDPYVINLQELIKCYNEFLSKEVCSAAFNNEEELEIFCERNGIASSKKWFIPLDFNWNNILGNDKWVEMYEIK